MSIKFKAGLAFALTVLTAAWAEKAEAYTCPVFQDQQVNGPFASGGTHGQASGFPFGTYLIQATQGSGTAALINLSIQALPGFSYRNGQKGFNGPNATLVVNFGTGPGVTAGETKEVEVTIFDISGRVVCFDSFVVTVQ